MGGLAQATLITTYDYWGYYNICFLGSEVRQPERTIPRAILLSVLFVSAFYIAMNLAALPSLRDAAAHAAECAAVRVQLVADIARSAFGLWAGYLIAALIVWTAFASVFSLLLGYSRVPYAAARDGNYFRFLAAVHPKHGIPHRSLVALGLVACCFCFFSLQQVITMLVITRILLQFFPATVRRDAAARAADRSWRGPSVCRSIRCRRWPPSPAFCFFSFIAYTRCGACCSPLASRSLARPLICSAPGALANGRSPHQQLGDIPSLPCDRESRPGVLPP